LLEFSTFSNFTCSTHALKFKNGLCIKGVWCYGWVILYGVSDFFFLLVAGKTLRDLVHLVECYVFHTLKMLSSTINKLLFLLSSFKGVWLFVFLLPMFSSNRYIFFGLILFSFFFVVFPLFGRLLNSSHIS